MAGEDSVRPSRDGDQFHYYWAARRCLRLLPPNTDLVAVSIEGPAVPDGNAVRDGSKSIDVAEYYGSTDPATATLINYVQLKHSTLREEEEWIASTMTETLQDFAKRYVALVAKFGVADVAKRFRFEFVTNRPFAPSLETGVQQLRNGQIGAKGKAAAHAMRIDVSIASGLAKILKLTGRTQYYLEQRSQLHDDLSGFLPEADRDASLQMKNLVEQRATTEFSDRPEITRIDILKALGTDSRDLYPAPSLIELPANIVPRAQLSELAQRIVSGGSLCVIRADAGVGKSVLSTQIGSQLPTGSATFVYDCFGNGAYRSASGYRHRCRDGLVQLANEFAGRSLSGPLIPTSKADPAAYVRAFLARVEVAAAAVRNGNTDAMLCVVIDAADNAQIAADEIHDGSSFPRLLLRERWPDNVRIVMTARPHRVEMLEPPADVPLLELEPFSEAETGQHLRSFYPFASNQEVQEFHRQTSRNPRVQATALAQKGPLRTILLGLAGDSRTVEDLIGELLESAVRKVLDDAPATERRQIDAVCAALATLRPFVPLDIVARVADASVAMVTSMAHDLQRPLIVREDAIQFRDEPTETWFRQRFRPTGPQLDEFIERLLPIAASSAYVAAGLPQLLLEAGRFDDLVRLALTDDALPTEPAMARRDVALQRLQFALKAAIRDKRYPEAAKLALKAGGETAADARQQKLISANTDLAPYFLETDQMLEQVTRRLIAGGDWAGSAHAYEAAFLSGAKDLAGDASSRLRLAYDWLQNWATRPPGKGGQSGSASDTDVAEIAMAELNMGGAGPCAKWLRRWRRRERSFGAGRKLCARLIDAGRYNDVADLAISAGNDLGLLLAITVELATVGRLPPKEAVKRATRLVTSRHVQIREPSSFGGEVLVLWAVTDLVVAAARYRAAPQALLAKTLSRYLTTNPRLLSGHSANYQNRRTVHLRAVSIRAVLRGQAVTVEGLKPDEMKPPPRSSQGRRRKDKRRYTADSGEVVRFEEEIGSLLPWHRLSAEVRLRKVPAGALDARIEEARSASSSARARSYDEDRPTVDEIADLWSDVAFGAADPATALDGLDEWRKSLRRPLFIPTLLSVARRAGRTDGCAKACMTFARSAFETMHEEREEAQSIAEVFVDVSRAVLLTSLSEAREYFEQAIEVSGKIGEENVDRWRALSDLAVAAGADGADRAELAYRYSRVAELVYAYTEHFDWPYSLEALSRLSPRSSPTILSRWMDRRFGHEATTLPELINALMAKGDVDPRDAICLLPIEGRWQHRELLSRALGATTDVAERKLIATHFIRYARRMHFDGKAWRALAVILAKHGVDGSEAIRLARASDNAAKERERARPTVKQTDKFSRRRRRRNWDAIFANVVLTDPVGLVEAHARFKKTKPPWSSELFYEAAIAKVAPGQEADLIAALDAAAIGGLFDAKGLLAAVPDGWIASPAVRRAVARYVKGLARRERELITTIRTYQPLNWRRVEQFGITQSEVFREAVTATGETALPVEHGQLFSLAGLLSTLIGPDDAAAALDYGLGLMDPMLLDTDDGAWRTELEPPRTVEESTAGYLWAALASPWAERRWEAAHAVGALCAVGRSEVLEPLATIARRGDGGPFSSPRLTFYALHAQLWLLIALARAAVDHPETVKVFAPLLQVAAQRANPHVLSREFAARAVEALIAAGVVAGTPGQSAALFSINASTLPPGSRRPGRRGGGRTAPKNRFLFGHDFVQNWLSPLANCFDAKPGEVEAEVASTMRLLWGTSATGSYRDDARALRQQFRDDDTYRLQSHWPKSDDLSFYQSSHGLMISAGKMLDRAPLAVTSYQSDPFGEWLDRHRLSLEAGVWLADRRDDKPSGLWLDLPSEGAAKIIDDAFIIRLLQGPNNTMHASADWEVHYGTIRQRVDIDSVLVTPEKSDDLARALQTAHNHDDYRLPTTEDDHDAIDVPRWSVSGWIRADERSRALDRFDPWAGGLYPRIPLPGAKAMAAVGVAGDRAAREWRDARGGLKLRAEIWSDGDGDDQDGAHDSGRRLLASRGALDALMRREGRDLLFEVRLRAERIETRHTRYMDKEPFDELRITRYVVLRPGQPAKAAARSHRTRRGPRRRARPRTVE